MACEAMPVRLSSHVLPRASIHAASSHVIENDFVGWIKAPRAGSTIANYLTKSGDNQRGNARKISGATMIKINTASMGTSMIMTSFMTLTNRTFAIAQEISKHKP